VLELVTVHRSVRDAVIASPGDIHIIKGHVVEVTHNFLKDVTEVTVVADDIHSVSDIERFLAQSVVAVEAPSTPSTTVEDLRQRFRRLP
jgi:prephenate dehydratase